MTGGWCQVAKKVKGGSPRARAMTWDDRLRGQCEERQTEDMEHQSRATECEEEGTKDKPIHSRLFFRSLWILHAFLSVA